MNTGLCVLRERFPTILSKTPPGILLESLEGQKAVLPQGFKLREINGRGLALLENAEGFVDHRYNDAAAYCSIAYGHLIKKAPCDGTEPPQFRDTVSRLTGERWLVEDLSQAQITVMTAVRVDLTVDQYAALCDIVYNIGATNFRKSTLLQQVNAKQFDRIPYQFRRWVKSGGKTWPGLVKRRNAEIALFFYGRPIPKAVPIPGEDLRPLDILTGTI